MKDYKLNGSVYEITLENDKKVKVATSWVDPCSLFFQSL